MPAAKEFTSPDDLVASDDEVTNIRRQSRLDSRRRNSNIDLTDEDHFLKSLDDIEQILTKAIPTREEQDKERNVKPVMENQKRIEKKQMKLKPVEEQVGKQEKEKKKVTEVVEGSGNEKSERDITVTFTTTEKAPYTSVELLTNEPVSRSSSFLESSLISRENLKFSGIFNANG